MNGAMGPAGLLGAGTHEVTIEIATLDPDVEIDDGDGRVYVTGKRAGISILAFGGTVATVFLYSAGHEGSEAYSGPVPGGVTFDMGPDAHRRMMGDPVWSRKPMQGVLGAVHVAEAYEVDGMRLHVEYDERHDGVDMYVVTRIARGGIIDDPATFIGMTERKASGRLYEIHHALNADGDEAGTYIKVPRTQIELWCEGGVVMAVHITPADETTMKDATVRVPGRVDFDMSRDRHRETLGQPIDTAETRIVDYEHARRHQSPGSAPAYDVFRLNDVDMYVEYAAGEESTALYILERADA